MGITTVSVNEFDGRMTNDPRDTAANVSRITEHLDDYTRKHALIVHPDNDFNPATDPNTSADFDSFRIQQIIYTGGVYYGLGVQSGNTKPKIFTKTGIGGTWATGSVTGDYGSLTDPSVYPLIFTMYQGKLYGLDNTGWWSYDLASPTWARGINNTTPVNRIPPVVHSKDDIMYFANGSANNFIGTLNVTSWANTALALPANHAIAGLCEYGNYLAIGTNNPDGNITVYLWDRDTSLTTVSEKIDWGSGTLAFLGQIDGTLIGCQILQASGLALEYTVVFKRYDGGAPETFAQFNCTAATIYAFAQRYNNLLHFLAEMTIDSTPLRGLWKVVKDADGKMSVSFDRKPRLDDTITAGKLYGFLRTGDYIHIACANAQENDKYIVTKTLNAYNTTAVYHTSINPNMVVGDRKKLKQLHSVSLAYESFGTDAACILRYRVDGGSWIRIFTETTNGAVSTEMFSQDDGTEFTAGREYEFSIEPSNAAVPTELRYSYEVYETLI